MPARLRYPNALIALECLVWMLSLAGCQPAREDRSIQWSQDAHAVGFQNGQQGVFIADQHGRKLTNIYQPGPGVIATSTPLWSPDGQSLVFTTARSNADQPPAILGFMNGQNPAGNLHFKQDITYTCWLCKKTDQGKPDAPVPLFEARADHPGYVAANLAVRWHPRLDRLYYIDQTSALEHGLFEYGLVSKASRKVFSRTSEGVLFDWTPDGSHLVCLLGSTPRLRTDGIWIGQPGESDWWHVPHSDELASGEYDSILEQLRATRPAWTKDGKRFAFPTYVPGPTSQEAGKHCLRLAAMATKTVQVWTDGDQPFRDLHWDDAGERLGLVWGADQGSLHIARRGESFSLGTNNLPVRRFVGWNKHGDRLAYVVPDALPLGSGFSWALLLFPDATARDQVYVANGAGSEPGKSVFSGLRVTFPLWSPQEDKLSLWATFVPAYRSVVSHLFGWGLRPGDPAAVFDVKSGQLAWMPVNAQEKVQVGHYYLLKRDYNQAWHWYQEAEKELPAPTPVVVQNMNAYWQALQGPRDFSFFQYLCLTKLGRAPEAKAKLDQFRRVFLPQLNRAAKDQANQDGSPEQEIQKLVGPGSFLGSLVQDLYIAEVFLSVDASRDGASFFRGAIKDATNDTARLSRAIVLGQLLLLQRRWPDYAELATETIAPLFTKVLKPAPAGDRRDFQDPSALAEFISGLALLPMGASDFLGQLPDKRVAALRPRWEKLRAQASESARPLLDLVLRGLYQKLGFQELRQVVTSRLHNRPILGIAPEEDASQIVHTLNRQMQDLMRGR
jgi:hypothetical protein